MSARKRLVVLTPSPEGAASAAAATVAVGAVACGVCCVLPFALPAVMLASSGGVLAVFAQAFWGALYLATVMVGGAWLWVFADTRRTGRRPNRSTLTMMVARHRGTRRRSRVAHHRASPDRDAQGVVPMTMTRRTLLGAAALLVPGIARSQTPVPADRVHAQ